MMAFNGDVLWLRPFFIVLFVFHLFACAEDLPEDAHGLRALADGIEAGRSDYEKAYNNWGSGDVASSFTAFLDGDDVVLIDEQMTRGETGRSANRFYFWGDVLFCYREKRTNRDGTVLEIEILFDRAGQVVATKQLADGTPTTVADYVAPMALKHARTLRDLAEEAARAIEQEEDEI